MKIRIKFRKFGVMQFIGHLDTMRYFQKAIRRSGIDVAYSQGFSPHQIMSFAAPLGVGLMSEGEYMDIEVHTTLSSEEAVKRLNQEMAKGVEVISYRLLPEKSKNAMSLVAAADYSITPREGEAFPFSCQDFFETRKRFLVDRNNIMLTKKTKKSEICLDVKPLIYEFTINEREDDVLTAGEKTEDRIFMKLAAGSVHNLKPEFVLQAFFEFCGLSYEPLAFQVTRKEVYADMGSEQEHQFIALEELGEEIAG